MERTKFHPAKSKIVVNSVVTICRVVVGFERGGCVPVRWKKECTVKQPHTNGRMTGLGQRRKALLIVYTQLKSHEDETTRSRQSAGAMKT